MVLKFCNNQHLSTTSAHLINGHAHHSQQFCIGFREQELDRCTKDREGQQTASIRKPKQNKKKSQREACRLFYALLFEVPLMECSAI